MRKKKKKSSKLKRRIKLTIAYLSLFSLLVVIGAGVIWFNALAAARDEMPSIESKLSDLRVVPSQILSSDGEVLYIEADEFREPVTLDKIPKIVQEAVVSAEDRRFFDHSGVDFWALVRAGFITAKDRRLSQGGSTLTMQLAKRLTSNGEKTFGRKLNDMAVAYEMENEWSKDHVLQLYLNEVYFGEGAYGIKAAALTYFGKQLDQLTTAEAAMLARCVRRPSDENPFKNLSRAIANRNIVLGIMRDDGIISQSQFDESSHEKVHLSSHKFIGSSRIIAAPYFVSSVLQDLKDNHPDIRLQDGGYKIYTTLNMKIQKTAEDSVSSVLSQFAGYNVNAGAVVLLNRSGGILAEVGGQDFRKDQFNIVTMGRLQPGSSFKPIVYSTAIANNIIGKDSYVSNERYVYRDPKTHKTWIPRNDNGDYGGTVSVREALAQSINVAAVRTLAAVGIDKVIKYAHDVFGFTSKLPRYPALALGTCEVSPMEMATAYSVFFLNGNRFTAYTIDHINDSDGTEVYVESPQIVQNVLDSGTTTQMDSLLQGVVEEGTGQAAQVIDGARGKTGTTNDNKDAWFCGYNKNFLCIAWTGNETYDRKHHRYIRQSMSSHAFGGTVSIHLWVDTMQAAIKDISSAHAPVPQAPAPDKNSFLATKPPDSVKLDPQNPPGSGSDATGTTSGLDGATSATTTSGSTTSTATSGSTGNPDSSGDSGLSTASTTGTIQGTSTATTTGTVNPDSSQPNKLPGSSSTVPPSAPVVVKPRTHAHKKVEYVTVEVCADSGELATPYCPETVMRTFVKGQQPTHYCRLHHR